MNWKQFLVEIIREPMSFGYVLLGVTTVLVLFVSLGKVTQDTSYGVDKGWELLKLLTVAWTGIVSGIAIGRHLEKESQKTSNQTSSQK